MANKGRLGFKFSKPRTLTARDPFTFLSLQRSRKDIGAAVGQPKAIAVTKNTLYQRGRLKVKSRVSVRRLHVRDPYNLLTSDPTFGSGRTTATFSPEADQFTNNPNKDFDPSKSPGSVTEVSTLTSRTRANTPGKASRGHGNVIKRTIFNQNQGKRLKRR